MRLEELIQIFSKVKMVDLTQPFFEENPTPYAWEQMWDRRDVGGGYGGRITVNEHSGTHVDAPVHVMKDGGTLDKSPLDTFFGAVALIDVRDKTSLDSDYFVSPEDILQWERKHGKIEKDFFVFFWTGWDRFWTDKKAFLGLDEEGVYHYPGLDEDAALMLAEERGVKGVGTDSYGVDSGESGSKGKPLAHRALLSRNVYIIEVLNNLAELPVLGAFCIALPLRIHKGTGSPARVIALIPEG